LNRQQRRAAARTGAPAGAAKRRGDALRATAVQHYEAGNFRAASRACQQLLALDTNDLIALHLTGLLALQGGFNEVAVDVLSRAVALNDGVADLHSSLAEALQRCGRVDQAITHYRRAISLAPHDVETIYNCANVMLRLGHPEEAITGYDRALALRPDFAEALQNRGNALFDLLYFGEALADYDHAISVNPRFVLAISNRANTLLQLKRFDEALESCERALAIDPRHTLALSIRANALFELRRFTDAAQAFDWLLTVEPDYPYAEGRAFYCRLLTCDWTGYDATLRAIGDKVLAGQRVAPPFMLLNMQASSEAQWQCARTFCNDRHPPSPHPFWRGERYDHPKIRIGYLSADFRHHPMAYVMVGLFERHDRSRFETTAFSFGPDPRDDFRRRLENSFDCFLDVRTKTDRELALLLRDREIDIAVDLMGYTNNGRPGILALRPAPIQVNYVGFAGTLGADYIDYVIADQIVIPEESRRFFAEQVADLPDTYWPTDTERVIAETPTRKAAGLPETGFVFCCFNQSHKIAPPIFDIWMRLLRQVEGSVLWLVEDDPDAACNLRREAERRGVAASRLIFAPRVRIEEYLARMPLADLLLDTLPFNAHTTASDALWTGLPLVTCAGSAFAGRVAASILYAAGLPELITDNLADYEALTLRLARDPERLAHIRAKLVRNRQSCPLFDTDRFRRHIESAYQTMWRRYQRGEPPAGFAVAPLANCP
jgi:predicted O-linked N-acetylglucosamine transferase (SPINDLY family)